MNRHAELLRRFALPFAVALLAACGGVLESAKPARQVYLLQPPLPARADSPSDAVLVMTVTAVPGLDTDHILVLGPDARLIPVANAHWADHLPEVFTSVTRRALAESGHFGRVVSGAVARPGEWLLAVELQAFYGLQDSTGSIDHVRLRMEVSVQCRGLRQRFTVDERVAVEAAGIAGLVAAHQRALNDALEPLPQRIASTCAQ